MQKIVQVHMLPTDKKPKDKHLVKLTAPGQSGLVLMEHYTELDGIPQHLYFTFEEEIKEGDWFYDFLYKVKQFKDKCKPAQYSRKIVATTNPELWNLPKKMSEYSHTDYKRYDIPKIPLSFVKQYVEKQVKEVKLECEVDIQTKPAIHDGQPVSEMTGIKEVLKLDSQGYVIISPIEEKIDWEQVFDNAQSMHLQEFINHYKNLK